jgi:hypothetical protein
MMLRTVVDEIVRRRLWPVAAVAAVLALVAAPLLFLKSGPQDAAPAGPAPAAQADLPSRAQHLLGRTDASGASDRRLSHSRHDPFKVPASARRSKRAGTTTSSSATTKQARAAKKVIDAVLNSSGGSTPTATASPAAMVPGGGPASSARPTASVASAAHRAKAATVRRPAAGSSSPTVDVRFGTEVGSPIVRRVPPRTMLHVGFKIVAVFVRWSPTTHKAVFAVAPNTVVDPDIRCRRVKGVCRYVDIPAGKFVRFTFLDDDGSRVTWRLDVVRAHARA